MLKIFSHCSCPAVLERFVPQLVAFEDDADWTEDVPPLVGFYLSGEPNQPEIESFYSLSQRASVVLIIAVHLDYASTDPQNPVSQVMKLRPVRGMLKKSLFRTPLFIFGDEGMPNTLENGLARLGRLCSLLEDLQAILYLSSGVRDLLRKPVADMKLLEALEAAALHHDASAPDRGWHSTTDPIKELHSEIEADLRELKRAAKSRSRKMCPEDLNIDQTAYSAAISKLETEIQLWEKYLTAIPGAWQHLESDLERLRDSLRTPLEALIVAGVFSSGKTTFINKLFKDKDPFATAVGHNTAARFLIRKAPPGEPESVRLTWHQGRLFPLLWTDIQIAPSDFSERDDAVRQIMGGGEVASVCKADFSGLRKCFRVNLKKPDRSYLVYAENKNYVVAEGESVAPPALLIRESAIKLTQRRNASVYMDRKAWEAACALRKHTPPIDLDAIVWHWPVESREPASEIRKFSQICDQWQTRPLVMKSTQDNPSDKIHLTSSDIALRSRPGNRMRRLYRRGHTDARSYPLEIHLRISEGDLHKLKTQLLLSDLKGKHRYLENDFISYLLKAAEVCLNDPALDNLSLVDTPGLGSISAEHEIVTKSALEAGNMFIVLVRSGPKLGRTNERIFSYIAKRMQELRVNTETRAEFIKSRVAVLYNWDSEHFASNSATIKAEIVKLESMISRKLGIPDASEMIFVTDLHKPVNYRILPDYPNLADFEEEWLNDEVINKCSRTMCQQIGRHLGEFGDSLSNHIRIREEQKRSVILNGRYINLLDTFLGDESWIDRAVVLRSELGEAARDFKDYTQRGLQGKWVTDSHIRTIQTRMRHIVNESSAMASAEDCKRLVAEYYIAVFMNIKEHFMQSLTREHVPGGDQKQMCAWFKDHYGTIFEKPMESVLRGLVGMMLEVKNIIESKFNIARDVQYMKDQNEKGCTKWRRFIRIFSEGPLQKAQARYSKKATELVNAIESWEQAFSDDCRSKIAKMSRVNTGQEIQEEDLTSEINSLTEFEHKMFEPVLNHYLPRDGS